MAEIKIPLYRTDNGEHKMRFFTEDHGLKYLRFERNATPKDTFGFGFSPDPLLGNMVFEDGKDLVLHDA